MRDEGGFERPFSNRREFRQPHPARAAEMIAGIIEEANLETVTESESDHDLTAIVRQLDYGSLAFDVLAAFDSHGYHELSRPAWLGDRYLRGKVWFGDDIMREASESQLRPGDAVPERVEVLECPGESLINRSPDVSPENGGWKAVLRIPASMFGDVWMGGIHPPDGYRRGESNE